MTKKQDGQDELLRLFEEQFGLMKKQLGFKSSLQEIDDIFFLKDIVLKEGFVSPKLSRMVCSRIVELFMSWAGYLHSLVMPNPGSMINVSESQMFPDKEKEDIMQLISKIMVLASRNSMVSLTKDKKNDAKFIDDSVALWKEINPKLQQIIRHVNEGWDEQSQAKKPEKYDEL